MTTVEAEAGFDIGSIMAQKESENFPVVMRVVPARPRSHLLAVYGFARLVDDIGDEYEGDRLAALDWVQEELHRARTGDATHPVMAQLTPLLSELEVDDEPFVALIEANRLDQRKSRYETQSELAEYCSLSANPVGRLVLEVFGAANEERIAQSDAVCTGLQIVEHLQDIGDDYSEKDRVYFPAEELTRFGVSEDELADPTASESLRRLVAHHCDSARALLMQGAPLVASLSGWARLTVAGYVGGGLAALDSIARADYDVLKKLRTPSKIRTATHVIRLVALQRMPLSRVRTLAVQLAGKMIGLIRIPWTKGRELLAQYGGKLLGALQAPMQKAREIADRVKGVVTGFLKAPGAKAREAADRVKGVVTGFLKAPGAKAREAADRVKGVVTGLLKAPGAKVREMVARILSKLIAFRKVPLSRIFRSWRENASRREQE